MASATMTYNIVTSESAEHGEAAERGWYQPGGWHCQTPTEPIEYDDIQDLAECAIYDGFTVEEGADWLVWGGGSDDWTETEDGQQGIETRHLHRGDDVSDEDWAQVRAWVKAGRVSTNTDLEV